jgi:hypothetical protein
MCSLPYHFWWRNAYDVKDDEANWAVLVDEQNIQILHCAPVLFLKHKPILYNGGKTL